MKKEENSKLKKIKYYMDLISNFVNKYILVKAGIILLILILLSQILR